MGTQTGQEPEEAEADAELMKVCYSLTCFLLLTCLACFPIEPRKTSLGLVPPTVDWTLPCQLLFLKNALLLDLMENFLS